MTMVFDIIWNSIKRAMHSFANIPGNSCSNSASNSSEGQAYATQQIDLLRGLRSLSRGDRRTGDSRFAACNLGLSRRMAVRRRGRIRDLDAAGVRPTPVGAAQ